MADLGYPQDAINLIGNIYSNSSTKFFGTHFGQTKPVHIQRGTIQGDTQPIPLYYISKTTTKMARTRKLWLQTQHITIHNKLSRICGRPSHNHKKI
jgi:hypothetical protein